MHREGWNLASALYYVGPFARPCNETAITESKISGSLAENAFMRRVLLAILLAACAALSFAQDGAEFGAHLPSQAAADVLRQLTSADAAFLPAGLVKSTYRREDLSSLIQYPTDQVVVMNLTGGEIRRALEKSISSYPQPNAGFLQISGIEVSFNKSAPAEQRIQEVTIGGVKLDDKHGYTVAMPASLARGGLGYFKVWDISKIVKTLPNTLESALKGKPYSETSPRWSASG